MSESVSNFTCITCRVVFANPDLQRVHYKSDWHRYNLKRKIAELGPISAELFERKVVAHNAEEVTDEKSVYKCVACRKTFQSAETLNNHLKSKKHKDAEKTAPEIVADPLPVDAVESESGEESETEGEGLGLEECLFCSLISDSMEENLRHMTAKHGFFIPDLEYCVDLEGLLYYLGSKVGQGFMCLWCREGGKLFRSVEAVQKHMQDKGHCKMWHEGRAVLEYEQFFDFSSSYPDAENADSESEAPVDVIEEKDWQLMLPSGATLGHRSLMRYYRQRLKPEVKGDRKQKSRRVVDKLLHQYRAIGWTGTTGEMAVRKAKDIKYMHKLVSKERAKQGIANNKLFVFRGR